MLKGPCQGFEAECAWGYSGWQVLGISHLRLGFYVAGTFDGIPHLRLVLSVLQHKNHCIFAPELGRAPNCSVGRADTVYLSHGVWGLAVPFSTFFTVGEGVCSKLVRSRLGLVGVP